VAGPLHRSRRTRRGARSDPARGDRHRPVLTPLAAPGLVVVIVLAAIIHARRKEPGAIAFNTVLLTLAAPVPGAASARTASDPYRQEPCGCGDQRARPRPENGPRPKPRAADLYHLGVLMTNLLILGGSDRLGIHLLARAAARGHDVRALVRNREAVQAPAGVELIRALPRTSTTSARQPKAVRR
jgi:hypothetical protein